MIREAKIHPVIAGQAEIGSKFVKLDHGHFPPEHPVRPDTILKYGVTLANRNTER